MGGSIRNITGIVKIFLNLTKNLTLARERSGKVYSNLKWSWIRFFLMHAVIKKDCSSQGHSIFPKDLEHSRLSMNSLK